MASVSFTKTLGSFSMAFHRLNETPKYYIDPSFQLFETCAVHIAVHSEVTGLLLDTRCPYKLSVPSIRFWILSQT